MANTKRIYKDRKPPKEPEDGLKVFPVTEVNQCPHCSAVPEICSKVADSTYQVPCPGCGMAGPTGKTIKLAVSHWNSIPRGRPPIYELIRTRALHVISEGLKVYEEALTTHKLTDQDCQAVAKMLEAATMCVDTWEL